MQQRKLQQHSQYHFLDGAISDSYRLEIFLVLPSGPHERDDIDDGDDNLGDVQRRVRHERGVRQDEVEVDLVWLDDEPARERRQMVTQANSLRRTRLRTDLGNRNGKKLLQ